MPPSPRPAVSVHVLGYNSRPYLRACLQAVLGQTHRPLEVIFSDNASSDGSAEFVRQLFPEVRVLANAENLGFCGGHNRGIRASSGEFVLVLNPDVRLTPTFVSSAVAALERRPDVGAATGRLLRCTFDPTSDRFQPLEPPVLDSTGLFLDRWRRAFDRGAGRPDDGRFASPEYVFASTGAAALYRRRMLEEIAEDGEYFDESFFMGYEDIDIGWRAQRSGWGCLYVPDAIGYHVRGYSHVIRKGRNRADSFRAAHTVKNRYLTMLKNESVAELARDLPWLVPAEMFGLVAVATLHPRALLGYVWALRAAPRALQRRRASSANSGRRPFQLRPWFRYV
jgi:GT2 family glycosyltransferase